LVFRFNTSLFTKKMNIQLYIGAQNRALWYTSADFKPLREGISDTHILYGIAMKNSIARMTIDLPLNYRNWYLVYLTIKARAFANVQFSVSRPYSLDII